MKLIIVDDGLNKYFVEYMNTFDTHIPVLKSQIDNYDLNNCDELIAVQKGTWLPDIVFKSNCKVFIANTEQLCDEKVQERVKSELLEVENKCGYKIKVYDYSIENCKILNNMGFETIYYPYISRNSEIEYLSTLLNSEKIYDIGFVGCINERRKTILDKLSSNGVKVGVIELFGNERDIELSRCKYILNIHWADHFNIFESIRCNRWLQAGFKVISEDSIDVAMNSNLYIFRYNELVDNILVLNNEYNLIMDFMNYIKDCLKPQGTDELIIDNEFNLSNYVKLKQDGMMLVKCNNNINLLPSGNDKIKIGNFVLIRKNVPLELDWLKKNGDIIFDNSNIPLYRRCVPPPIETINHVFIISKVIGATSRNNKNYIEYGVRNGNSVEPISKLVKKVFAVDINDYFPQNKNIEFYKMLTDNFSNNYLPNINFDYAFIDADHSSKQVLIDFLNIYKYINKGGYIFLHDTYPCSEFFLRADYCNDCYLTPIKIREVFPDIEMLTLPINPGLTIIRK